MSRFKVEELCFDLREAANAERFKTAPDTFLSQYDLTIDEKEAVQKGDLGTLYKKGVTYGALAALSRVLGYDNVRYVKALRAAAGLPEDKEQIEVLNKRAQVRS